MQPRAWRCLSAAESGAALSSFPEQGDPFLHPDFLTALESAGAVGQGTSWMPSHLLFTRNNRPAALLPLYLKADSRGEYVFDHSWAQAYHRHGRAYYPKLVSAIPFTPVPGPRLMLAEGESLAAWLPQVLQAVREVCLEQGASGWHGLFVNEEWLRPAIDAGLACREGCRFHWTNPGYRDFADFLDTLTSKKRKDIRRERRRLQEQGIRCKVLAGREVDSSTWDFFYECYIRTYLEHGQQPYLNRRFLQQLAGRIPDRLILVIAEDDAGPMASALFFHDRNRLFGRYWGCLRRADALHFEVCYYQGMEICLHRGFSDFDPGTQGEHKLLRGFAPTPTYSLHWLREPAFQSAIQRFVQEEAGAVQRYMDAAREALPYRSPR